MSLLDAREIDDLTIYEVKIKEMLRKYWAYGTKRFDIDRLKMDWGYIPKQYDVLMYEVNAETPMLRFAPYSFRSNFFVYNGKVFTEVKILSEIFESAISVGWRDVERYIERGRL